MDLETLKEIKFMFDLYSDHSTLCLGYKRLVELIEEKESKLTEVYPKRIYWCVTKFEDEFNVTGKGKVIIIDISKNDFNGVNPFNIGDVIRENNSKIGYEITGIEQFKKLFADLTGDNVGLIVKEHKYE